MKTTSIRWIAAALLLATCSRTLTGATITWDGGPNTGDIQTIGADVVLGANSTWDVLQGHGGNNTHVGLHAVRARASATADQARSPCHAKAMQERPDAMRRSGHRRSTARTPRRGVRTWA